MWDIRLEITFYDPTVYPTIDLPKWKLEYSYPLIFFTHQFNPNSSLLSIGPVHFCFEGRWVVFFIPFQILIEHSPSKQWRLIRRHFMWRLIWVYTICLCPTKRALGSYGLNIFLGGQKNNRIENFFLVPTIHVLNEK